MLALLALLALAVAIPPSFAGPPAAPPSALAGDPLADLLADFEARRWSEAEPALRVALERAPQAPVLHFLLGETLAGLERPLEALAELEQAVVLRPDRPRFWHSLARVAADLGQCNRALAALDRALALAAEPVYQYDAATCLVTLGRLAPAATRLDLALATAPRHFAALLLRSTIARDLGEALAAKEFADRAVELAPLSPAARTARGMALLDLGQPAWAIDDFHAALAEAAALNEARYGLAQALRALGRDEEAAAELERMRTQAESRERAEQLAAAIPLAPERPQPRIELARLLLDSGDASGAVRQLEAAVALTREEDPAARDLLDLAQEKKARWAP